MNQQWLSLISLAAFLLVPLGGLPAAATEEHSPSNASQVPTWAQREGIKITEETTASHRVFSMERFVETAGPCDGFCAQCEGSCLVGLMFCGLEDPPCGYRGYTCGPADDHDGCVCNCLFYRP